jgi:hypothetical protein
LKYSMQARVLLIGPGDLGQRIARGLVHSAHVGELVLAGRKDTSLAALLDACGHARVRFAELDLHGTGGLERLLRAERPDLIVQCAVELSPWWVSDRADPFWTALHRAGLGLQLPFQLPLLMRVMEAVRETGLGTPVVNGSYPDLTHPILATRGLAPAIGIGNAGMIELQVRAVLRARGLEVEPVRVAAHHAHVTPVVHAAAPAAPSTSPRVYLGEEGTRADALAFAGPPLPADRRLNELSAAAALPLLDALLGGPAVRLSTPAPMGLPGGWPVRVDANAIALDLPPGAEREELIAFQWASAHRDGIASVDAEGTVFFTPEAREALGPWGELAEPLPLDGLAARRELLMSRC